MQKLAKDLKQGERLIVFGKLGILEKIEISDIGKQGKRKVRIELNIDGNKSVVIRPEDYPFEVSDDRRIN